jgi:hypothetical protein
MCDDVGHTVIELSLLVDVERNPENPRDCAFVHPDHGCPVSIPDKKSLMWGIKLRQAQSYTWEIAD